MARSCGCCGGQGNDLDGSSKKPALASTGLESVTKRAATDSASSRKIEQTLNNTIDSSTTPANALAGQRGEAPSPVVISDITTKRDWTLTDWHDLHLENCRVVTAARQRVTEDGPKKVGRAAQCTPLSTGMNKRSQ